MAVSSHCLRIADYPEVHSAIADVCFDWEDLASHLSVYQPSVRTIKIDGKDSADCLRTMLDTWLRRRSDDQPLPSWRGLCDALAHKNLSLSQKISSQHQCGCSYCTGVTGTQAVEIVSPLYDELYEKLNRPVVIRVAEYMFREDAFTKEQLEKIQDSTGNEKEALFTEMEGAVSVDHYNLKIFATSLKTEESTDSIGKSLLEKYKQNGFPPRKKKLVVGMKYKKEFQRRRTKLGELCCETTTLLENENIDVFVLRRKLGLSFREMKPDLKFCTDLSDVVDDAIRPRLSVIQIDYLEAVFDLCKLPKDLIVAYNEDIDGFCKSMSIEHSYGQLLMEEFRTHISEPESITFVLEWEGNRHCLQDLRDLFKKLVGKYSSDVKVDVIFQSNSFIVECYTPSHLRPLIVKMLHQNETVLHEERVLSVMAGELTVYSKTSRVSKTTLIEVLMEDTTRASDVGDDFSDAMATETSGFVEDDPELSADVSFADAMRIYESTIRKLKTNNAELRTELSMRENMVKKMSGEIDVLTQVKKFVGSHEQEVDEELCEIEADEKSPKSAKRKASDRAESDSPVSKKQREDQDTTAVSPLLEQREKELNKMASKLETMESLRKSNEQEIKNLKSQLELRTTREAQLINAQRQAIRILALPFYSDFNHPPVMVVMTDFNNCKLIHKHSWFSPCFYSHPGGYKMCLKVIASGEEEGKGTHVSVYVHLMSGEYDDLLGWPFRGKIQLQLLNRQADKNHISAIVRYDVSATDGSVGGRIFNGLITESGIVARHGEGVPLFVGHNKLGHYDGESETQYLHDDSLTFNVMAVEVDEACLATTITAGVPDTSIFKEFTMSDFSTFKSSNSTWTSEPFYTHTNGYKFVLVVYANGVYKYKGKSVSVFAHLMKGENDDNLSFPFRGSIKVQVMNQTGKTDRNHVEQVINFNEKNDPDGRCGARVYTLSLDYLMAGRSTDGWGHANFISHDLLYFNRYRGTQYLTDNKIVFRVAKVEVFS